MKKLGFGAVVICAMMGLTACSGNRTVGQPAAADVTPTPLAEILASPEAFDGQTVVLKGILTGQCASLCDFTYTEGRQSVTVFMGSVKAPRIPVGRPVRVTASVHHGESQVVLTALGLETGSKGGAP
jgi:hypothetical protein